MTGSSGTRSRKPKILAVASGGGHWIQLLRLQPAWAGYEVVFVSTHDAEEQVQGSKFYRIHDASRHSVISLVISSLQLFFIVLRERPTHVVSTGAAPGYLAIRFGKMLRRRTIWIDSIANIDEISLSGKLVGKYADVWLTQWPHLAKTGGPRFGGNVL